jgi:hypothetical protein
MVHTADPCAVWDPVAELWRVYWSFFDAEAEAEGLPATGMMGATSPDGTALVPHGVLSLEQQGTFDENSVETCDVVVLEDDESPTGQRFLMFYSGSQLPQGGPSDDPEASGPYSIALATSTDGVRYEPLEAELSRDGVAGVLFGVSDALGGEEVDGNFITDPVIAIRGGTLHMWTLCIRQVPEPFGGICHHTSVDAIHWEHRGLVTGLDRAFPIQPTVFYNPATDLFEMYVVMDTPEEEARVHDLETNLTLRVVGYFHATSPDGDTWTQTSDERAFVEDLSRPWENRGLATGADAELKDGVVYFFYPSFTTMGGSILGNLHNWPLNLARALAADE